MSTPTIAKALFLAFTVALFATALTAKAVAPDKSESGKSIYQVPIKFKSDAGEALQLSKFKGREVVITMVYATCPVACPLTVKKLREVERLFKERGRSPEFVLVTFDPESDTPAELAKFRKRQDIGAANWHFLTGTTTGSRKLSMLLGIKFTKNAGTGEIMHDNKILVLNENGEIANELNGLDADPALLFH